MDSDKLDRVEAHLRLVAANDQKALDTTNDEEMRLVANGRLSLAHFLLKIIDGEAND